MKKQPRTGTGNFGSPYKEPRGDLIAFRLPKSLDNRLRAVVGWRSKADNQKLHEFIAKAVRKELEGIPGDYEFLPELEAGDRVRYVGDDEFLARAFIVAAEKRKSVLIDSLNEGRTELSSRAWGNNRLEVPVEDLRKA